MYKRVLIPYIFALFIYTTHSASVQSLLERTDEPKYQILLVDHQSEVPVSQILDLLFMQHFHFSFNTIDYILGEFGRNLCHYNLSKKYAEI